jgi:hypothetical protein
MKLLKRIMRNVMNSIKDFFIVLIVSFLSLEGLSFGASKLNLFLINDTPSLYASSVTTEYQDIAYGRTEREKWGAWHASNGVFRHRKSCFDVTMSFNEIGARDETFSDISPSSLILLGDSFAEGFGVSRNDMSEFLIQENLDVSVLNFGAAGSFGPLQQLLIYNEYDDLPHQGVIIYLLPSNDFTDNDIEVWQAIDQTRYRPYFSPEGDPLIPFYFPNAIPRDNFASGVSGSLKQFIKNFWLSNALRSALILMRGETQVMTDNTDVTPSFYYDATELQQTNLTLAYEAILDLASDKNVLFVIIPSGNDIIRYNKDPLPDSYKNGSWYQTLFSFKDRESQRVEILDLMDYLPSQPQNLFFECDGHWSPNGNLWAANIISRFVRDENLFMIRE